MEYRLTISNANTKHKPWRAALPRWHKWNGDPIYIFQDAAELLDFLNRHIPGDHSRDAALLAQNKAPCTQFYRVEIGTHKMTEYTSF